MVTPQMSQEDSSSPLHWVVVQTQPRRELLAATLLEIQLGATVFLPEVLQYRYGKNRLWPLFPGYLFVECNFDNHPPSGIDTVLGVIRLLAADSKPLFVAGQTVLSLQNLCARINDGGGLATYFFRPGERVRLLGGPLVGLEGAFVKNASADERAVVLLRFLNRENPVTVDLHLLESADRGWRPPRQRSTRGGGRRINRPDTT